MCPQNQIINNLMKVNLKWKMKYLFRNTKVRSIIYYTGNNKL